MKALALAKAVQEIERAELSAVALELALSSVPRSRLIVGRRQLAMMEYIERTVAQGLSEEYAIRTAATVHHKERDHVRRLWRAHIGEPDVPT